MRSVATKQIAPANPRSSEYARQLAPVLARVTVETMRGMRAPTLLRQYAVPDVLADVERRASLSLRLRLGKQPPNSAVRVGTVRTCQVSNTALEASAVVQEPYRARCLAFRLELRHSGWRMTALEVG
ncbi:Rv3235 family protein [Dermabacteraceae bacterium P13095]